MEQQPPRTSKLLTAQEDSSSVEDFKKRIEENPSLYEEEKGEVIKIIPEITLTVGQTEAIQAMTKWYNSSSLFFTLSGSAGTGKTFITKRFLESIGMKYNARVSAPTHKAKKVIAKATGVEAITIQSLLGLKPNFDIDDFDINNLQFDPQGENQMRYCRFVIIDESSMLSADLFKYITDAARRERCKILFLGDILQLPPVNESVSKVFTEVAEIFTLTEIVRQKNTNPIAELLVMIREDIINGTHNFRKFLKEHPIMINNSGEGYQVYEDKDDFLTDAQNLFDTIDFNSNPDYVRYSAWMNESIGTFNHYLRKAIHGNMVPIVKIDELLMAYNTVRGASKYAPDLLTNSEDYRVQSVVSGKNSYGIAGFEVKLESCSLGSINTVFIVNPLDYRDFLTQHDKLFSKALKQKGKAWVDYFSFRRETLVITEVKDARGKLVVKKDLDYGYGVSVHKTQGSTYENIMINGDNLDRNSNSEECKKLWYVALSRCSKKCNILYSTL